MYSVRDRVMVRARVRVRERVRKRKRGRNKARSVLIEPETRGDSGKREGKKQKKCHAGTEARGKELLSRHGTAGKCVGERIGGYLVVQREGSQTRSSMEWTYSL